MSLKRSKGSTPGIGSSQTPYAAKVAITSDQTITLDTPTEVAWDTTIFATDASLVSLADNAFVAPVDGVYEVQMLVYWSTGNVVDFRVHAFIDDVAPANNYLLRYAGAAAQYPAKIASGMFEMSAGEKLTIDVYSTISTYLRGTSSAERTWATFKRIA